MTFKEFAKSLSKNGVEGELIKTIFVSLITSFALLAIAYFLKLKYIENFIPKYGFFLFFAILSYAIILPSVRYVRAYREFPCMSGMMIGMTIGIFLGAWNGKCCGIMGMMEGTMAGFMGGIMGAMTAIMMLNDNLKA